MRDHLVGIALLCAACGSDDDFTCSLADRHGTYLLTYTYVSGNCGEIPSVLVTATPSTSEEGDCAFDAEPVVSADECKVETKVVCNSNGTLIRATGVTEQANESGSLLTGTITFNSTLCTGTYRMRYVRQ